MLPAIVSVRPQQGHYLLLGRKRADASDRTSAHSSTDTLPSPPRRLASQPPLGPGWRPMAGRGLLSFTCRSLTLPAGTLAADGRVSGSGFRPAMIGMLDGLAGVGGRTHEHGGAGAHSQEAGLPDTASCPTAKMLPASCLPLLSPCRVWERAGRDLSPPPVPPRLPAAMFLFLVRRLDT